MTFTIKQHWSFLVLLALLAAAPLSVRAADMAASPAPAVIETVPATAVTTESNNPAKPDAVPGVFPSQAAAAPEFDLEAGTETHPMIRLSPDKPEIVRLDTDARSVLVGNPAHLNVIMDNTRTLVLVPRDPGATSFSVVGRDGKTVMSRYVIVAGPADKYIRIRRACGNGGANCDETSIYYCPDTCYKTEVMNASQGAPQTGTAPLPTTGGASPIAGAPSPTTINVPQGQ